MQERQIGCDEGASAPAPAGTFGWVLEDPNRVGIILRRGPREVAFFYTASIEERVVNDIPVRLARGLLIWSHGSALLLLQGSTIAELISPLHVLRGIVRPSHHPRSGIEDVVLAEVKKEMSQKEVFLLLSKLI